MCKRNHIILMVQHANEYKTQTIHWIFKFMLCVNYAGWS